MIKTCVICGREFNARNITGKTCSKECSKEYNRQIRYAGKTTPDSKICIICGKRFIPRNSKHKTCSSTCAKEQRNHRRRHSRGEAVALPERACQHCGKAFTPAFDGDKFCSDDCRYVFYPYHLQLAIGKLFRELDE